MLLHARGRMFDWLKRNERDNSDCGLGSPVQHFARHKMLGENLLAVHVNYLARGDAALLGKAPRSTSCIARAAMIISGMHRFYASGSPMPASISASGTDSLATTPKTGKQKPELNMFEEMRQLADADKTISPAEIIRMATNHRKPRHYRPGRTGPAKLAEETLPPI